VGAWIAESDFGTAPAVTRALHDAVDAGFLTYLPQHTAAEAERECAAFLKRRFAWDVPVERVHLVADVVEGLRVMLRNFAAPGQPVVVPTPCYAPFLSTPRKLGRAVIEVPSVQADGRWQLDLDGIERALSGGGVLVLCNPHNPLGQVMREAEMVLLAEVVDRTGSRVFSDEIHAPVVYAGAHHIPYASTSEIAAQHTVTATATSKGWNIPGLKAAQLILTSDADQQLWVERDIVPSQNGSILGAIGAIAAYRDSAEWLDETIQRFDRNRRLLTELLRVHAPHARYHEPEATYLAWIDLSAYDLPSRPAEYLAQHARVVTSEGADSGVGYEKWVRFNFAMAPELLTRAVESLGRALASR
jgi:cystathionine beta-lyase